MKAVLLQAYGGVDQLEYTDVPAPVPQSGEVLIKVISTSVNPIDFKLRQGLMKAVMPLPLPFILGSEAAGEITAVGDGVTSCAIGDLVMGMLNHSYAEYVTAKAHDMTGIPQGLDAIDAGVLPVVALTGAQIIEDGVQPKPGDMVMITGAMGGVGRTAIFVARQHGATVIAGVRSKQLTNAQNIGADRLVALDDDSAITDLPELDAIADTVGGSTLQKLLPKLKKGGVLASVLGKPAAVDSSIIIREIYAHPDSNRLHKLAEDARDGKFSVPIEKRFRLSSIREAHTEAQAGGHGKFAILP